MRAQVSEMAFELFIDRGYEETTIDDICAVAEISRSTFFRYFPSKEDVLLDEIAVIGEQLLEALTERPDDESPWLALRRAATPLVSHHDTDPERRLKLIRLVTTTPVLIAHRHQKTASWQKLLRPEVARRLGVDPHDLTDPRPTTLIAAMLGCLDAATEAWAAGDGAAPFAAVLDRAMDSIDPAP
jgi:AcrR family transcriptional regulator